MQQARGEALPHAPGAAAPARSSLPASPARVPAGPAREVHAAGSGGALPHAPSAAAPARSSLPASPARVPAGPAREVHAAGSGGSPASCPRCCCSRPLVAPRLARPGAGRAGSGGACSRLGGKPCLMPQVLLLPPARRSPPRPLGCRPGRLGRHRCCCPLLLPAAARVEECRGGRIPITVGTNRSPGCDWLVFCKVFLFWGQFFSRTLCLITLHQLKQKMGWGGGGNLGARMPGGIRKPMARAIVFRKVSASPPLLSAGAFSHPKRSRPSRRECEHRQKTDIATNACRRPLATLELLG